MRIKRISAHALSIIVLMRLDTCLYVLCKHSIILQCFTFFIQNENILYRTQCILSRSAILIFSYIIIWMITIFSCFVLGWLELFWLPNSRIVFGGAHIRRGKRLVHVAFIPSSSCLQTGQIVEIIKWHSYNHGKHCRRSVQSNLRPLYHCLHLCRDGNAALWQGLYRIRLRKMGLRATKVEFYRFFA